MERTCDDCGYTGTDFKQMDAGKTDTTGEHRPRIVGYECPDCGSWIT